MYKEHETNIDYTNTNEGILIKTIEYVPKRMDVEVHRDRSDTGRGREQIEATRYAAEELAHLLLKNIKGEPIDDMGLTLYRFSISIMTNNEREELLRDIENYKASNNNLLNEIYRATVETNSLLAESLWTTLKRKMKW